MFTSEYYIGFDRYRPRENKLPKKCMGKSFRLISVKMFHSPAVEITKTANQIEQEFNCKIMVTNIIKIK